MPTPRLRGKEGSEMRCSICGSCGYDGALDDGGEYVCVDCWADGEAAYRGRTAVSFVPATFSLPVTYPAGMQRRFVAACNHKEAADE